VTTDDYVSIIADVVVTNSFALHGRALMIVST